LHHGATTASRDLDARADRNPPAACRGQFAGRCSRVKVRGRGPQPGRPAGSVPRPVETLRRAGRWVEADGPWHARFCRVTIAATSWQPKTHGQHGMTPQQFIAKWQKANLSERSAAQQHFLDLCELLEQQKPAEADPDGTHYTFERGAHKTDGGEGWADVWMRGYFGWEYKGKHKDLAAAYRQLLQYREALENPPLLVVCDLDRFEIHTNFTGTIKKVHAFDLAGLAEPVNLDILRRVFTDPDSLKPGKTAEIITREAAERIGQIADSMYTRKIPAPRAAHFLMKLMLCMFAEDIGLLPDKLFSRILTNSKQDPARLAKQLTALFTAMAHGGDFGAETVLHFNGGLFADADVIEPTVSEIQHLSDANIHNWADVEP